MTENEIREIVRDEIEKFVYEVHSRAVGDYIPKAKGKGEILSGSKDALLDTIRTVVNKII